MSSTASIITLLLISCFPVVVFSCALHNGQVESLNEDVTASAHFPAAPPPPPPPAVESASIVGGKKASKAIQKRHAFLTVFHKGSDTVYYCGGSIISRRHILTAAHCLIEPMTKKVATGVSIYLGDSIIRTSDPVLASTIFIHRDYRAVPVNGVDVYSDDVAVIELSQEITSPDVEFIELAEAKDLPAPGSLVYGVGFGQTTFGGSMSSLLLQVKLRLQAHGKCKAAEARDFKPYLNKAVSICATDPGFPDKGGRDTCDGDSGGALYYILGQGASRRIVQVGITSWASTGCAGAGTVAWYTRLPRYVGAILDLIDRGNGPVNSIWKRHR